MAITEDQRVRILNLGAAGVTIPEIMKEIGCSKSTIMRVRRSTRAETMRPPPPQPPIETRPEAQHAIQCEVLTESAAAKLAIGIYSEAIVELREAQRLAHSMLMQEIGAASTHAKNWMTVYGIAFDKLNAAVDGITKYDKLHGARIPKRPSFKTSVVELVDVTAEAKARKKQPVTPEKKASGE
jgi:IS30 family transposase